VDYRRALLALPFLAIACAGLRLPGDDRAGDAGPAHANLGGVEERMPAPPRKPATTYTPVEPPSPDYAAPPLKSERKARGRRGRADPDGDFTRALVEVVAEVATSAGSAAPVPDERYHGFARDFARLARPERGLPSEALRFVVSHHGIVASDPQILTVSSADDRPGVLAHFRQAMSRLFGPRADPQFNRVGVGFDLRGTTLMTVVALWQQSLVLEPMPRQIASGRTVKIRGRFLQPFSQPTLVVTMPEGYVRSLPMSRDRDWFGAELRCSFGDGSYQLEMVAADATGPRVLANFPLFCGVSPPTDVAAHDEEDPADIDPGRAEQELFALVNTERRAAGLLPLVWDNRLAAIARSHSRDMAENGFIAHVSPTTGDTVTRVSKAGGRYEMVTENVGQEGGVRQAHQGLMHSPGHRANVLNQHALFIGIGVVVNRSRIGAPLIVTELFAR
jgi:uncharacterized protein YkwD